MKKNLLKLILLSFILVLSSFASAELIIQKYSPDFVSGTNNPNPSVCICGDIVDEIIIINSAPFPQVFNLKTDLPNALISSDSITLLPNQEIKIPISISADCSQKSRTESYSVFISSNTGVEQVISRNIDFMKCQTIDAFLFVDKNSSNICESVTYTLKLHNPSSVIEQYLIGPTKHVELFNPIGYTVSLNPNQVSFLNFSFNTPCDASGIINNNFRIKAERTKLNVNLEHDLFIEPGFNFTLTGSENLNLCRYEIIKIPYSITNNGLVKNTYDLSLKNAPSFVKLENNVLTLNPGETAYFNLLFEPGRKAKNHELTLIAKSRVGNVLTEKEIVLSLSECYVSSLSIISPESLTICESSELVAVSLKNNGTYTETYNLETNTPKAVLSKNTVSLKPGEEIILDLYLDLYGFNGKSLFEVHAYSNRNLLKHWSDNIVIDVVPSYKCSEIFFISNKKIYSRHSYEEIIITIQNRGIQSNNFTIIYEGSDFLELKENNVFLEAKKYFDVILVKKGETDINEFYFSLNMTTPQGEYYFKEFKVVLTGVPLSEKIINYIFENPCFLIFLVLFVLIISFLLLSLIFGPLFSRILKISILIVLSLIIILLLVFNGFPERLNPELEQSNDPYHFRIYETDSLKINLNDYVNDPDNDTLLFGLIDEPLHISVILEDNVLTISSVNFTGYDRFRVFADDNRGGLIVTPRFLVEVVELKKVSFIEWYELYCVYVNILMLFILFILVLVFKTRSVNKKKVKKRVKDENIEIQPVKKQSKKLDVIKKRFYRKSKKKFSEKKIKK